VVTGCTRPLKPNLSFQCSRTSVATSRTLNQLILYLRYQWLPPVAICRVFQVWIQEYSYLKRRGSRVERGVRAYSPAWSEPPTRNSVARVGMRKRHLTAVCNGETSWWEQESARGSYQGETPGIFIVLSGFATSDFSAGNHLISVKLVRRAKPMENRQSSRPPAWPFA